MIVHEYVGVLYGLYIHYIFCILELYRLYMLCIACCSLTDSSWDTLRIGACILFIILSFSVDSVWRQWDGFCKLGAGKPLRTERLIQYLECLDLKGVLFSHVHSHCCLCIMYIPYKYFPSTTSVLITKGGSQQNRAYLHELWKPVSLLTVWKGVWVIVQMGQGQWGPWWCMAWIECRGRW